MSSVSFNDLKIIISQLSKQEISATRKFLVAFDSQSHKSNNKNCRLFDFLVEYPMANYAKARQFQGSQTDKRSFDQVCRRLKERIAESLILDVNIRKADMPETYLSQKLYIRKKLLIASVLMERGAENEAFSICQRIIKLAKEYELYAEAHEALYWMRNEQGFGLELDLAVDIQKELEFYRYCDQAMYRARELYCSCIVNAQTEPDLSYQRALGHARGELAVMYQNTRSATIAYYYYLVEIRYHFVMANFQVCCNTGIKLAELVCTHPVLKTEIRLGSAYVELAKAYTHLDDHEQSLYFSEKALILLPETSSHYEAAKEMEFRALYNLERKQEASASLKKLLDITDRKKHPWIYWKRLFYQACLNFSLANYADTMRVMQRIGKLKTDQESWNIGRRIVTILCKIEMNQFDEADKSIESLRKYLQRNVHAKQSELYYKKATKALVLLSNKSYIFEDIKNILSLGFSQESDIQPENASPDIKLFKVWLNARLKGKTNNSGPGIGGLDNTLDSVA